jgi:hypothetical protein
MSPAIDAAAAATSTPLVNWAGLGKVLLLAVSTAVVIVGSFSLGMAALDVYQWSLERARRAEGGAQPGEAGPAGVGGGAEAAAPARVAYPSLAVAVVFFAICVGGVAVGLWGILTK